MTCARRFVLLWTVAGASCGGGASGAASSTTSTPKVASVCHDAYADYETRWRLARTEELTEFVAGDPDVLEEILYTELASLPSRVELEKLREIYAALDAFLWDAPWPRALAATEVAIERCGERAVRPHG